MADMSSTLSIAARVEELSRISDWLDATASAWQIPESVTFSMKLCCEEIASNAVRHGMTPHTAGTDLVDPLVIRLASVASTLHLEIEDRGPAFDPTQVAEPELPDSLENAQIGGLGIHLARQFSDSMAYERVRGANRVSLTFTWPGEPKRPARLS